MLERFEDAYGESSIPPLSLICLKVLISLDFDKCVTDRRTDQRTDQRTEKPAYRDVRTHRKIDYLKKEPRPKIILDQGDFLGNTQIGVFSLK